MTNSGDNILDFGLDPTSGKKTKKKQPKKRSFYSESEESQKSSSSSSSSGSDSGSGSGSGTSDSESDSDTNGSEGTGNSDEEKTRKVPFSGKKKPDEELLRGSGNKSYSNIHETTRKVVRYKKKSDKSETESDSGSSVDESGSDSSSEDSYARTPKNSTGQKNKENVGVLFQMSPEAKPSKAASSKALESLSTDIMSLTLSPSSQTPTSTSTAQPNSAIQVCLLVLLFSATLAMICFPLC